jgi:RNA polymerase primary sigma factor
MALSKMRRVMYNKERQRSVDEIAEEQRERDRMEVIREFFETKDRERRAG